MKLSTFLAKYVNDESQVKVIFPEKNVSAIGTPDDFFKGEISVLNANVFDFMITKLEVGYSALIWITKTDYTMCEVM